jgi:hypothetical protein
MWEGRPAAARIGRLNHEVTSWREPSFWASGPEGTSLTKSHSAPLLGAEHEKVFRCKDLAS